MIDRSCFVLQWTQITIIISLIISSYIHSNNVWFISSGGWRKETWIKNWKLKTFINFEHRNFAIFLPSIFGLNASFNLTQKIFNKNMKKLDIKLLINCWIMFGSQHLMGQRTAKCEFKIFRFEPIFWTIRIA